ncbi:MAG TPA: BamA/TamA family outer membrane protein, partial [Thermoanaerobaculia bacterium]
GRLKGTFLDMILRTAAVEDRFLSVSEASGLSPEWPRGNARYFYGAKFLSWLSAREGSEKLRQFVNEYSGNIIPFRVNATADDVYGESMNALWNEWSSQQQAAYRAEVARLGTITPRERITDLGDETRHPLLSPDGTRLAYTHEGPFERPTIRVIELSTGREMARHQVNNASPISWSPDGRSIAYSQLEFVGSYALLSDLYVWEIGGDARRITRGARLKDPAFTPGGRSIVAIQNEAGRNRIVEVAVDSGAVTPLVTPSDYVQFSEPVVNASGDRIAVAQWENGRIDIVLYERRGHLISNLTRSLARSTNSSPRFGPNDTLHFSSDVTGIANVYAVSATGGAPRRLTNVYGGAFFPTTRDGRRFYVSDYSSDGFDIAMFDATGNYAVVARERQAVADDIPAPLSATTASRPYSAWQSVRPRWWFPIVGSVATADDDLELTVGATTSGGDVLGFHSYTATATTTFSDERSDSHFSIVYAYDRLYPTISVGAFRFDEDVINFVAGSENLGTYTETTTRLIAQATFPFRRVRHQTYVWGGVVRDDIDASEAADIVPPDLEDFGIFRGALQGIRLGAQFNNAQQYAWSISPENGFNIRFDYENLTESLGSDASMQQLRGDLRAFRTIPWRRSPMGRHVIAARVAAAENRGDYVFQRELLVGGSEDVGFPNLDIRRLPVRGYGEGTLRGDRAAIASLEYRFPIWEIERGPTTWPIFFNRVVGSVFADGGRAWGFSIFDPQFDTIASVGAEAGLDLVLGFALPLRYRFGVARRLRDPGNGDVEFYAGLGTAF